MNILTSDLSPRQVNEMLSQDSVSEYRSGEAPEAERLDYWRRVLQEADYQEFPAYQVPAQLPATTGVLVQRPACAQAMRPFEGRSVAGGAGGAAIRDIVYGIFAVWLYKHTAQRDLVFGVALDGAPSATDLDGTPGAAEIVPVRIALDDDMPWRAVASQCAAAVRDTAPQALPADVLNREIFHRDGPVAMRAGIFVTVSPQAPPADSAGQPPAAWPGAEVLDLSLGVELAGDTVRVTVACRPGTTDKTTAYRLAERFEHLLAQAADRPDAPIGESSIIAPAEAAQIASNGTGPAKHYPPGTIPEQFGRQVLRNPGGVAVTDSTDEISYAELNHRANQLARFIRERGVRAGTRCAILQERSIAAVISILAVVKAGAAYVPLDPGTPPLRLAAVLADAEVKVALTDSLSAGAVPPGDHRVIDVDRDADAIAAGPGTEFPVALSPSSLAYVIYTSGSTGQPKGVLVGHGSVTHFAELAREFFTTSATDRIAQCAALWFDVSVYEIFGALLTGASVHIVSNEAKATPGQAQQFFRTQRITALMTTPSLLEFLDPDELPDLRVMSIGGEPFPGALTTRWARGRRFINGYGPAEATVEVVGKVCEGKWDTSPPIGRPLANHRAYVLDARMRQAPAGVPGELCVGGPGVACGYLGRPGLTGELFVPDPFSGEPGARLYRTGDLVCWLPSGELQYLGRIDRQVKIRGMRAELGEVESALLRHPAVSKAAVVPLDDGGDVRLVAFVTADGEMAAADVRAEAAAWLPSYMVPADIIEVQTLPLTDSGKVDARALESLLPARTAEPDAGSAPASDAERQVAGIVSEVLNNGAAFGVDDDIFAIGANSLQVLRVLSRVRSEFGVVITPREFFEKPTVSGIAAALAVARV